MFCQIKGQVSKGTVQGAIKVLASFSSRSFYEDTEMTIRLKPYMLSVDTFVEKSPMWYKSCYASFTSPINIDYKKEKI